MPSKPGRDARHVRQVIVAAMKNWSNLDAEANQAYYTSSTKAVFFDFTPMQYVGWATYMNEIKKVQESIRKFKINLNDDLVVQVRGEMAYAHGTWRMSFVFKNGSRRKLSGRLTEILEKRMGKWKIIHEHASVPTQN